jgi:transcriptional repressor NrdR
MTYPRFTHGFPLPNSLALCQYIVMVCVYCGSDTQVTNSRHQKRANQVWRRRKCTSCGAIFSTLEGIDTSQALSVQKKNGLEPFSRDTLLITVYDSLRHRKTALRDATALTATIISTLTPLADNAVIDRDVVATVTATVLQRFDKPAATHYRAFHPVS